MKKIIISIEGLAGGGKTTLVNGLQKHGFTVFPEINDYIKETASVKRFTLDNSNSKKSNKWFLDIEIQRLDAALKSEKPVVMDRCFVSQIAYNYAKDITQGVNNLGILKEMMLLSKLYVPYIIYLHIESQVSIDRMITRDKDNQRQYVINGEPDYQFDFIKENRAYYEKIMPSLGNNGLKINGLETVDQQIGMILRWIKGKKNFIENFDLNLLFN